MMLKGNFLKKGQVWIETVVYTLIGLSIIAIILTMAMPQIDKMKDKSVVEQTATALNELDKKIIEITQAPGNSRVIEFKIAKGKLEINQDTDSIVYYLEDTKLELSEPGENIKQGNLVLLTKKEAARFTISLTLNYDNIDIINQNSDPIILQAGATPYKIVIENQDTTTSGDAKIQVSIL